MVSRVEIRQLRYFLAVARTLNFTKAAAEVHIAQPPLSRQIANLEAELGTELFDRSPRGVRLTKAGLFLQERATEILMRLERTKREVTEMGAKPNLPFKIGFDLSFLYGRTPLIFRFLRDRYPTYNFQYLEIPSAEQPGAIRNGQVDLALGHTLIVDEQVEQITLRNEQLVLALARDHPAFRGVDQSLRLADVRAETLILHEEQSSKGSRDPVSRFIEHVGFNPAQTMSIRGLPAALGLVAAGIGISIVPARALLMRGQDVSYAPLAEDEAISPVVLSTLRGIHATMIAEILAEVQRLRAPESSQEPNAGKERPVIQAPP
jgi:LysR family transcriptional regulator, benzoate and cis,cis-muconate-responsive activator of ben and cat genes